MDDGSADTTTEVGLGYVDKYGCDKVRVLSLAKNRGKGGAVRMGMLKARWESFSMFTFDKLSRVESMRDILYQV